MANSASGKRVPAAHDCPKVISSYHRGQLIKFVVLVILTTEI